MVLHIKDLAKSYKDVAALKGLSFKLNPGESVALLGPNGSGKSTAIKMMVSLLRPDRGQFLWDGIDLFPTPERIRDLMGYVSQEIAMDKVLTGLEFMRFSAGLLHLDWRVHEPRARELLAKLGLTEAENRMVGKYSGGMKRRLDLASALLHEPRILVLDEPTNGLDIEARELIWSMVRHFLDNGGMLILVSHDFREVGALADSALILKDGDVIRQGSPNTLQRALGTFIIRLKTREFMTRADIESAWSLFENWGEAMHPRADDEYATLAYEGELSMQALQAKIYKDAETAGTQIFSLNIQNPELEDAYRFAVGGTP